ncbi:MAG: FMN-binding glutamate synthase family protein [Methanobacteriales archaeon HGW-Methanobacteriales-1]|nr:MAG: FMN-binding glutamate synthase family protein [Methanobacteriales archaeon HGW-Methanobacteriales-1]
MVEPSNIRINITDSEENRTKCYCRLCPSYPHDCEGEILFCGKNASKCEIEVAGCLCSKCPVYSKYNLNGNYYCDKVETGTSKVLMRKQNTHEDLQFYKKIVNIKDQSLTGQNIVGAMGSQKKQLFSLDDLFFVPAQVNKIPLNMEEPVNTTLTLGPNAKKPLNVSSPIMISGMSFGAVSKKVKIVIAESAEKLKIAYNSGEGGIINENRTTNLDYKIVQYSTGRYGVDEDILKSAAAIEIRFGQGAYPGKGSYLPAEKITPEVARMRGLKKGESSYSPAHHPDMTDIDAIKNKVTWLRELTNGIPIGAKIGCGDVEADVKVLAEVGVDFIALDGFGGGTGATDLYVRDNVGMPVFAAIPLAFNTLDNLGVKDKTTLIASGGLRSSADFTKCLALGADAVYIGTAALIAINCQQYRVCYSGLCPTGIATQNPELVKQLDIPEGIAKLTKFIELSTQEIANLTRIVGKNDINLLFKDDIRSESPDMAKLTGVKWMNGQYIN